MDCKGCEYETWVAAEMAHPGFEFVKNFDPGPSPEHTCIAKIDADKYPLIHLLFETLANDCGVTAQANFEGEKLEFWVPVEHEPFLGQYEDRLMDLTVAELETFAIGEDADQVALMAKYDQNQNLLACISNMLTSWFEGVR